MVGIVITYPGYIMDEVVPAVKALTGKVELKTVTLEDIDESTRADFLLIPGGSCDEAVVHNGLHNLIRRVNEKNGLLAAICNGALVLASAGVLKGRRCTHTAHPKYAPLPEFKELLDAAKIYFKDSIYVDEDIVLDRNFISAKPKAKHEFADAVLGALMSRELNRGS